MPTTARGVGKGTIVLDDFEHAEAIFVMGQNTGTNSLRMMSNLVEARKRCVPTVAVNPMPERALIRFTEPQDVVQMVADAERQGQHPGHAGPGSEHGGR